MKLFYRQFLFLFDEKENGRGKTGGFSCFLVFPVL